jgi:hypothetical protein
VQFAASAVAQRRRETVAPRTRAISTSHVAKTRFIVDAAHSNAVRAVSARNLQLCFTQ